MSEFFISTHGVRKGLTDTALKTAESGYLTRRLVDVAQDLLISEEDCGTDRAYVVEDIIDRKTNSVIEGIFDRLVGRYAKEDVINPTTQEVLVESDELITDTSLVKSLKRVLKKSSFVMYSPVSPSTVYVRSVMVATWQRVRSLKWARLLVSWLLNPLGNRVLS